MSYYADVLGHVINVDYDGGGHGGYSAKFKLENLYPEMDKDRTKIENMDIRNIKYHINNDNIRYKEDKLALKLKPKATDDGDNRYMHDDLIRECIPTDTQISSDSYDDSQKYPEIIFEETRTNGSYRSSEKVKKSRNSSTEIPTSPFSLLSYFFSGMGMEIDNKKNVESFPDSIEDSNVFNILRCNVRDDIEDSLRGGDQVNADPPYDIHGLDGNRVSNTKEHEEGVIMNSKNFSIHDINDESESLYPIRSSSFSSSSLSKEKPNSILSRRRILKASSFSLVEGVIGDRGRDSPFREALGLIHFDNYQQSSDGSIPDEEGVVEKNVRFSMYDGRNEGGANDRRSESEGDSGTGEGVEEGDGEELEGEGLFSRTEIVGLRLMFSLFDRYVRFLH